MLLAQNVGQLVDAHHQAFNLATASIRCLRFAVELRPHDSIDGLAGIAERARQRARSDKSQHHRECDGAKIKAERAESSDRIVKPRPGSPKSLCEHEENKRQQGNHEHPFRDRQPLHGPAFLCRKSQWAARNAGTSSHGLDLRLRYTRS